MRPSTLHPLPAQSFSRRLCFDLENRPAAYWYDGQTTSEVTAFGWKWDDEPRVRTMLLLPGRKFETDDGIVLEYKDAYTLFVEELQYADLVYGHNIRGHDLGMLQGQLFRLGLPMLRPMLTSDTLKDLVKTKDLSRSLENLASLRKLSGSKVRMAITDWEAANQLSDAGIEATRARVTTDVVLQAELRADLLTMGVLRPPRRWKP